MTTTPDTSCACPEYAATTVSRRGLFRGAAAVGGVSTLVGGAVVTSYGAAPAYAAATPASSVVVVLSLRGAADGLSLVVPHGDPTYYAARPRIAVPAANLVAKDGFFGLHPSLSPLLPLWSAGKLAAVHATGMAVANRSHFAAMELVEDANPGSTTRVGWLNRLIGTDANTSALQGVAVGGAAPPASLFGPEPVMSFSDLDRASIAGDDQWDPNRTRVRSLNTMWQKPKSPMAKAMRSAMSSVADLGPAKAQPDNEARYPATDLGRALSGVARTIRGNVGVSMVTVDQGEWDMHTDLGTLSWGSMIRNASELASSIATFFTDLGDQADKVTLVTISEFGRRVAENANYGLDHGWGNVMFLAGAGVKGGTYYGTWPGLTNSLDADLTVTTDYRSVLAEVVASRTTASTAAVFPGFTRERVGVMVGQ